MNPDPPALKRLIAMIRRPPSLAEEYYVDEDLLGKAGLRKKGRKVAHFEAGDPDLEFGTFEANYGAWIRRGAILATCDTNGHHHLYVLARSSDSLVVSSGEPVRDKRAVDVTTEPGPWWEQLRAEIPRVEAEFAQLEALGAQAAKERREAYLRKQEIQRQQELSEAHRSFAESQRRRDPQRDGAALIVLTLGIIAALLFLAVV